MNKIINNEILWKIIGVEKDIIVKDFQRKEQKTITSYFIKKDILKVKSFIVDNEPKKVKEVVFGLVRNPFLRNLINIIINFRVTFVL